MRRRASTLPRMGAHTVAWLTRGDRPVLGERHLQIFEALAELGSLNAVAKRLHISYRDAWGKIRQAEAALGVELIAARAGGARGGGSRLTAAGEEVTRRLRAFQREHRQSTARCAALYFGESAGRLPQAARGERLLLATTTSLVDTGLLPALLAPFSQRHGVEVEVLRVGSGAALRLVHAGRADVVLAHAPAAEEHSVAIGDTLNRREVMTNDFVLVGPPDDPADVRGRDVRTALQRIAARRAPFLSRADGSGTHERERQLWGAAGIKPGVWHLPGRCGMADLLHRASAIRAYALTDRGTYAALADDVTLGIVCSDTAHLMNVYSVLAANPYQHAGANYLVAMALIAWLTAPPAQELIGAYRVDGQTIAQPATEPRATRPRERRLRA